MKSPGHREHPNHKVREIHLDQPIKVKVDGELVADSRDVIEVDEDRNPPRFYFPRADVKMNSLSRSETTSKCPFKGTAHYFGVRAGERTLSDAVWSYEDPYEEHTALKDRVAFYEEKFPEIELVR
jgi:uncharacterized protein (DUF427 family)